MQNNSGKFVSFGTVLKKKDVPRRKTSNYKNVAVTLLNLSTEKFDFKNANKRNKLTKSFE